MVCNYTCCPSFVTHAADRNAGRSIPAVGLGTWQGQFGTDTPDAVKESIIHAIKFGYRLVDTAQYYGVESVVGEAIRDCGVPRAEITVVTKFWGDSAHDPAAALERSLTAMGLDYIDIFMMHWPNTMTPNGEPQAYPGSPPYWETWKKMEPLVSERCRGIAVSNFTQKTLAKLLEVATVIPLVNEVELHALNPNLKLVPYCLDKGIRVISWSTLGSERHETGKNPIITDPLFTDMAKKYACPVGVLSLSWAVARGIVVIPKSSKNSRIEENIRLVTLTQQDVDILSHSADTIGRMRLIRRIKGLLYEIDGKETIMGWDEYDFGFEDEKGTWLC